MKADTASLLQRADALEAEYLLLLAIENPTVERAQNGPYNCTPASGALERLAENQR